MKETMLVAFMAASLVAEVSSIPTPRSKQKEEELVWDVKKATTDSADKAAQSENTNNTTVNEKSHKKEKKNNKVIVDETKEKKTTKTDIIEKQPKSDLEKEKKDDYYYLGTPMSEEEIYMYDDYGDDDYPLDKTIVEDGERLIKDLKDELHLPVPARLKEVMLPESGRVMDGGELETEAVKGAKNNFFEESAEDSLLPISSRLKDLGILESERVMDEPDWHPRVEEQQKKDMLEQEPVAERVMGGNEENTKPGGDGKMKMNLNLKDLDGNPSDITIGAAAVGLMSQAVKSKGPDDNQVNAVAGFGHQIMGLVSELEKDTKY